MSILEAILMSVGLAMDAFAVSICTGLELKNIKFKDAIKVGLWFGIFQALMPLIGYLLGSRFESLITNIDHWVAFVLLVFIGGKMIYEAFHDDGEETPVKVLTFSVLMIQGIATSIDALSVGFTIADYDLLSAAICAFIIAVVTFIICMGGLVIGKGAGTKLSGKATILGGVILIFIGLEIFITGVF